MDFNYVFDLYVYFCARMKMKVMWMVVIAFLPASGCVNLEPDNLGEGTGSIVGRVKDAQGDGSPDAQVYIQTNQAVFTKSNQDGEFSLLQVPVGKYTLLAISEDGLGGYAKVKVFGGEKTQVEILLAQTGQVEGRVTLAGEQNHQGTLVYVPGTSFCGFTKEDGKYRLSWVIQGCYRIRIEHAGFYPKDIDKVCIKLGQGKTLQEITLIRDQNNNSKECLDDSDCDTNQTCKDKRCHYKPGYQDEACDKKDNDGDGLTDEGIAESCGESIGICESGISLCLGGSMSDCLGKVEPQIEVKGDLLDNDCDGYTDEDTTCEADLNGVCMNSDDRGACNGLFIKDHSDCQDGQETACCIPGATCEAALDGVCMNSDDRDACDGLFVIGHSDCPGGQETACCIPEATCEAERGGVCMNSDDRDACDGSGVGSWVVGHPDCPGGWQTACCIP